MLTNVYYYHLYKPYIVSNRESGTYSAKSSRIADRKTKSLPDPLNQTYILNKSLKDEIIRYAHNVSYGVTNFKMTVSQTAADMEGFNRNIHEHDLETAIRWIGDDLEEFTENYNQAAGFMQSQPHSPGLRTFSMELNDNINYNRDRLSLLGVELSEDGRVTFDRSRLSGLSQDQVNTAIGENIGIFGDLHRYASDLLTAPLSEHMNFRGLSYHYNYKMGTMVTDGFNIIESGLLIDKVV